MRERLSKFWSAFRYWLRTHRRGIFLAFWFVLSLAAGGAYYFLAQYFSLPMINPLGSSSAEPSMVLADPITKETVHPISGIYSSESESARWKARRPLAVMIDNHQLARPYQFNLQKADLVYEAVAEGGITRFLAIFHSQDVEKLGPVRSSRVYYIDWALEFPAYYAHVGGASTPGPANIRPYITAHKVLDLDQFRLGSPTYTFGGNVMLGRTVLSHINYTSTAKLWTAGSNLYPGTNKLPSFESWQFKADVPLMDRPESQTVSFSFGSLPTYAGRWVYDRTRNVYWREQGGKKHIDQATGEQLFAKNIVLIYMNERLAGDGTSHRLYTTTGQGSAEIYQDGRKILATWKRPTLSARTQFFRRDSAAPIEFNRGSTWIEVIPK